jgi:hypothetical protein
MRPLRPECNTRSCESHPGPVPTRQTAVQMQLTNLNGKGRRRPFSGLPTCAHTDSLASRRAHTRRKHARARGSLPLGQGLPRPGPLQPLSARFMPCSVLRRSHQAGWGRKPASWLPRALARGAGALLWHRDRARVVERGQAGIVFFPGHGPVGLWVCSGPRLIEVPHALDQHQPRFDLTLSQVEHPARGNIRL